MGGTHECPGQRLACAHNMGDETSRPGAPFKVLSFNIRNSRALTDGRNTWLLRRRATIAAIESYEADLIGLQEVRRSQLAYVLRKLPGYVAISYGRDRGDLAGEHCTVLINPVRFEVIDWRIRWFSNTPDVPGTRHTASIYPRMATSVDLRDRRDGRRLTFANLHLDHRSTVARRAAADLLAEWFGSGEHPAVIVGDYNCAVDDEALSPLYEAGLVDALSQIPARGEWSASHHRFTGAVHGDRIDHVFVPSEIEVLDSGIDFSRHLGRLPSDHWPVQARLRIR